MQKPRNIYRLLVLLTGLALVACGAEGREGSITSGSEGSDVTKIGLVNGQGVSGSAPLYGDICNGKVRVERFSITPGEGTIPERHTLEITDRGELDPVLNTAPMHQLYEGQFYTTGDCTFRFDGVGITSVDGYQEAGVSYTQWISTEGGY